MSVKLILRKIFLDTFIFDAIQSLRHQVHLNTWNKNNRPVPPPHIVKRLLMKEIARQYPANVFVETGTFDGDMTYACRNIFKKIFTIEIFPELANQAKKRFQKFTHISVIEGDSAEKLPQVLAIVNEPCIFWLDGHFSGMHHGQETGCGTKETPIMEELQYLSAHPVKNHILLIDDARCFNGEHDYPSLKEFKQKTNQLFPNHSLAVKDDIIRVLPKDL